jgi:enoyl-CoA hydratase/carnithine racemase
MDWMSSHNPEALAEEWSAILAKSAPNSKAIFRSAGIKVTYLDHLKVDYKGSKVELGTLLKYDEELAEYVAEVLKRAPLAIGVLKKLVHEGLDLPLFDALNLEIDLTAPLIETADGREGVGAFIEKRPADFKGR